MNGLTNAYFDAVSAMLQRIAQEETEAIDGAAQLMADAITRKNNVFAFGASHSALPVQDVVYRAGGLMLINPILGPGIDAVTTRPPALGSQMERMPGFAKAILDNSPISAGDVLIVVSVSGRNIVPVEMAQIAQERGIRVIAVTSQAYTDAVASRHDSGKKVKHFADVVIDNKVDVGDAVLTLDSVPQKFGPASGITSTAIMHALTAATIEKLAARGMTPPIYLATNVDGGEEWNAKLLAEHADRLFYC